MISNQTKIGRNTVIWHPVNIYNSTIGNDCMVAAFVEIGGATIGNNCRVQAFSYICPGTHIGNNVFIGPRVTFLNDKHPVSAISKIFVMDHVKIGGGAIILPGVTLGEGSFVGAGSVVIKDTKPNKTYVGNPARELKEAMDEIVTLS